MPRSGSALKVSAEIRSALTERLGAALRPAPHRRLWEWAEENIVLSPKTGTFSPGRYRTRHTPHVREVMEAFQNLDIEMIVLPFAAQTSKTLTETLCVAWAIENDPANMLFVMPSEQMAKSFSSNRLQQVIKETPSVDAHRLTARGKFNVLEMELDNCVIALTGAGSASNLASRPIRYLFLDEIDKYPKALGDEGSPSRLAIERTKTFPNRKIFESSTPTVETAEIWQNYLATDRNEWFAPCPECGKCFVVTWDRIVFDEDGTDDERAESVRCVCPSCGHEIRDRDRRAFLGAGHWEPTSAEGKAGWKGFHIAEFASCIGRPWPDLVRNFIQATRRSKSGYHEDLKTFVCSVMAEPWRVNTDTLRKADSFDEYADDYPRGTVPTYMDVTGLTAGIDTQDNGFYYVVRAWGGGESLESWLVDYGFCEDLEHLERAVMRKFPSEDGLRDFRVTGAFMDAMGHRTQEVYNWCRTIGRNARVVPTKGEQKIAGGVQYSFASVDRDARGRATPGSLQLCHVNTTLFKDWLDGKLRVPMEAPGAWHVFRGVDEEYKQQMASEYRNEEGIWNLRSSQARNHYWDCEVLALARAAQLRFDRAAPPSPPEDARNMENTGRRKSRY